MQGGSVGTHPPLGPTEGGSEIIKYCGCIALSQARPGAHCSRAAFSSGSKRSVRSRLAAARRDPRRSGNLYSASSSKQAPTEGTVKALSVLRSHRIDHLRRGAVLVVKALPSSR